MTGTKDSELERLRREVLELTDRLKWALLIRDGALAILSDTRDTVVESLPQNSKGKFSWEGTQIEDEEAHGFCGNVMSRIKTLRDALLSVREDITLFEKATQSRLGNLRDYGTAAMEARRRREELTRASERASREEYLRQEEREQGKRR